MALEAVVEKLDEVPEPYRELYTERNGRYEVTGIVGMKTQADIDRIMEGLNKERNDHKATRERLSAFGDLDPEDVQAKLDRIAELEAAAGDKIDENKLNEMVEGRLRTKLGPVEREKQKLAKELQDTLEKVGQYEARERQRSIHDAVRKAALESKVIDTALEDVLILAERMFEISEDGKVLVKDQVGATPGVDPAVWLTEMQSKRPHWWPASQGGGARGSGAGGSGFAQNPFSADHWNMTEQAALIRTDRARAEQMAKAAGTSIGGGRPVGKG